MSKLSKTLIVIIVIALIGFFAWTTTHNHSLPAGVSAARRAAAERFNVSEEEVLIQTALEKEWTDSCLGLGGAAESCLQVITPGYEVVVQVKGNRYMYRTDMEGKIVRELI
jgi:hypothetical protein